MSAPLFRTLVRLRCPNCGVGKVLDGHFKVHARCANCKLDFNRGNPAYYSGAVLINYLLSSATMLAMFLLAIVLTWPAVPWRWLGYGAPILVAALIIVLHPVAKVILLTVDVNFRPVTPDEFQ